MKPTVNPTVKPTVLVTGATGYVGRHCSAYLSAQGYDVLNGSRRAQPSLSSEKWMAYGDSPDIDSLKSALKNRPVVVHCAGQNHVGPDPLSQSSAWSANVDVTRTLAKLAAEAGVQHFIFLSSTLVMAGSRNAAGRVGLDALPAPLSAYAKTKLAAEQALAETSAATGLRYTVIRPPMVYGPGVRGNFSRLVKLARSGVPLPLAYATAAKSFIFVDNLSSAIAATVAKTPPEANNAFFVSDGQDTSTAELIGEISRQGCGQAWLFPMPQPVLRLAFRLLGLHEEWEKLFAPSVVDSAPFSEWAEWTAPVTFREAIRRSVLETATTTT